MNRAVTDHSRGYKIPFSFSFAGITGHVDADDNVDFDGRTFKVSKAHKALKYTIEMCRCDALGLNKDWRFYSNPRYVDGYTVLMLDKPLYNDEFKALAVDDQGVADIVSTTQGFHLGKRVFFGDLPDIVKDVVFEYKLKGVI